MASALVISILGGDGRWGLNREPLRLNEAFRDMSPMSQFAGFRSFFVRW